MTGVEDTFVSFAAFCAARADQINPPTSQNAQQHTTNTNSPYNRFMAPLMRFTGQIEGMSSSPEAVAGVILHTLTTRNPRTRYIATPDARIMLAVMLRMSDGMRDAIWSKMLGLRESTGT